MFENSSDSDAYPHDNIDSQFVQVVPLTAMAVLQGYVVAGVVGISQ
jgi:hypothetical protein